MKPLAPVRRAAGLHPHFFRDALTRAATGDPLFWPLASAARAFAGYDDFPPVDALTSVFGGDAPVRFVPAAPRRRRGGSVDVRALYDARITLDREVPTRHRCLHDLMNVLVWGTFPLAKSALHARQHRAIAERLAPGARRLPPTRTPELDALALLDEGGVVLVSHPSTDGATTLVFGHAIYESLVLGVAPAVVAAIVLAVDRPVVRPVEHVRPNAAAARPVSPLLDPMQPHAHNRTGLECGLVGAVDRALAAAIEDPGMLRSPGELRRVRITSATGAPPGERWAILAP